MTSLTPKLVKHIPAWFPGASFQRTAQKWREIVYRSVEEPVAFVKQQMVRFECQDMSRIYATDR